MSVTSFISNWIWQFPQTLCGVIWKAIKKDSIISEVENDSTREVEATCYIVKAGGGVTLGKYIFLSQTYVDQTYHIAHECGHVKQSKILGPLYLLVIGLPSILHAWLNDTIGCCKKKGTYYHFYTEHWANKLMDLDDIPLNS